MQRYQPTSSLVTLMESFRQMTNDCIRIGLANNVQTLKRLSLLAYRLLTNQYEVPSYYRLCAISKAAGILSARTKSIRRGFPNKTPYLSRRLLVSCYGLVVKDGSLFVPLSARRYEKIPLNSHTLAFLSQPAAKVRSFTLTERTLSICIAKEVEVSKKIEGVVGIDRNLYNVTAGSSERVTYYDVSKAAEIVENVVSIIRSFKRNDARIRKELAAKYGQRRRERVQQMLHRVSKNIVMEAEKNKNAIAFEDLKGIRKLYRRGNEQGRKFRRRMNSWPFGELKRQVEYKAAWRGVPVVMLSVRETKGTTMDCPRCGERLQAAVRGDVTHHRQLWCEGCKRWDDRDLVAVMNISRRGWVRFAQSQGEGEAGETVKGNPDGRREQVILRVDASKPSFLPKNENSAEPLEIRNNLKPTDSNRGSLGPVAQSRYGEQSG
jgi:putative transposase